ncbi:MAG: 4-hydroxybenzoate octaprenyltransferase [Alphaproteobacteria bacterium]|nr:4-hydroxybenzoate octaprenyltransferase [Alphaproteobacteria bacterium]
MPAKIHLYAQLMRLDKPIGWWLLLWPCWWGLILAAPPVGAWSATEVFYAVLFLLGAIIMRGAGCVVNDVWDRDLDKSVLRTQTRPLANGALTLREALWFLAGLLLLGLVILLQFNVAAQLVGASLLLLVGVYPLMKRITWWPQLFLGLTFNAGVWVAAAAYQPQFYLPNLILAPALLYAAGIFWTLGYDTIYALQDAKDDALVGIKSTARLFGRWSRLAVAAFYGIMLVLLAALLWHLGAHPSSYVVWVVLACHLFWQTRHIDWVNPHAAGKLFKSNREAGLWVALMLIAAKATPFEWP